MAPSENRARTSLSVVNSDRKIDIAVTKPLYLEWRSSVRDRFFADILAGAVVDLQVGLLDDVQQHDEPATRLKLSARQTHALEIEALARAQYVESRTYSCFAVSS